ncbi:MAG: hypothetical protein LBV67_02080 [Streptococcaceae bacterium]|jgi:nucleoside phosphorylase|nr:hypothetical protein [Streptococcaceae bacterium]
MKVGIVSTVDEKLDAFLEELENFSVVNYEGDDYTVSKIGGEEVFIVYPQGNTKENIQAVVEKLIHHFEVARLIFIGFAGAIDYKLAPLAMIIGKNHLNHQNGEIYKASNKLIGSLSRSYPSAKVVDVITYGYFLENVEEKKKLKTNYPNIAAIDRHSAYLAEIASIHEIPFISLYAITDNANDQAVKNYKKYEILATSKTVDIILEFIKSKHFDK